MLARGTATVSTPAQERIGNFIDAAVDNPDLARNLVAADPWLLNARWHLQETVLHFLCVEGFTEGVALLLKLGASPHLVNQLGDCPLVDVVVLGNVEIARLLLAAGADADATSDPWGNVLHRAVGSGPAEMVELLLSHGATTNYVTDLNETVFDAVPDDAELAEAVMAVLERHGVRRR